MKRYFQEFYYQYTSSGFSTDEALSQILPSLTDPSESNSMNMQFVMLEKKGSGRGPSSPVPHCLPILSWVVKHESYKVKVSKHELPSTYGERNNLL